MTRELCARICTAMAAPHMKKKFPLHPSRPELICWGCDKYCATGAMLCGNGSDRTQHPFELFGADWLVLGKNYAPDPTLPAQPSESSS